MYSVAIIIGLLFYTNKRCASSELSYIQGLQFVTACMQAGWVYISVILILLALTIVIAASVTMSVYGDITGKGKMTPHRYYKLVYTFYDYRMRQ